MTDEVNDLPFTENIDDVNYQEAVLKTKKLDLEISLLAQQASTQARRIEAIKSISSIAGVLTALVGVLALTWSVYQGLQQLDASNRNQSQERLNKAIEQMGSTNESQRVTGLLSLQALLSASQPELHRPILLTLVTQLSNEQSVDVRDKIVEILKQIDERSVSQDVIDAASRALLSKSRSLVDDGSTRAELLRNPNSNLSSKLLVAKSVGDAIAALATKNPSRQDFKGIFCFKCNFRDAKLPNAVFDNAILVRADFTGAFLEGASFKSAILEQAIFVSADLRQTNFRGAASSNGGSLIFSLNAALKSPDFEFLGLSFFRGDSVGPNFDCANLEGADFSNRIIFTLVSASSEKTVSPYYSMSFVKANLYGAKFDGAALIGLTKGKNGVLPFEGGSSSMWSKWPLGVEDIVHMALSKDKVTTPKPFDVLPELANDEKAFMIHLNKDVQINPSSQSFVGSLRLMAKAFAGSNWQSAKLPVGIAGVLATSSEKKASEESSLAPGSYLQSPSSPCRDLR